MYSWNKGSHGIFVNSTKHDAETWIVYQFSPNKRSCSFAMNDVHIGQQYDMLHVDLFNSIYQKSNNEKIKSPKDIDLTISWW